MDYLADTNVLIRSIEPRHLMHAHAVNALEKILRSGDAVYITPQNVIEFWNVCTRPAERNGLGLLPSEAHQQTSRLESLFAVLPEIPAIYPEWRRLVSANAVSGAQVHDARLVAIMGVYGLRRILTFNADDFKRYAGIEIVNPTSLQ